MRKTLPNGEVVSQGYDALNRVSAIEARQPGSPGDLLYRSSYRYDLAGNVVFIREDNNNPPLPAWRQITQAYDRAHRLVSEQFRHSPGSTAGTDRDVTYAYDAADNRTSREIQYFSPDRETYTCNTLNQLTHLSATVPARTAQTASCRAIDYTYDLNGNRSTRDDGITAATYEYDFDQRLISVGPTGHPRFTCAYDYRTRRIAFTIDPGGGGLPSTTTLSFSGGTSVQEYTNTTLDVEYIRGSDMGGGIGGLLYSLRSGTASYTHYNHRGDVVAKTDTAGTLTYQAAYEAYGTRTEETGSTLDRQKANTKDKDPTGLLNEGFRYRDLETGTFITRDPAGFIDGPNLYTYVRQNPWTKFDPEGLEPDVPKYTNFDSAFIDASLDIFNYTAKPGQSSPKKVEYRSDIWRDPATGKFGYTQPYGTQNPITTGPVNPNERPKGSLYEGVTHDHPGTAGPDGPQFSEPGKAAVPGSGGDKNVADTTEKPIGVVQEGADGNPIIKKYTPQKGAKDDQDIRGKGTITEYDPKTKSFSPERTPPPPPPIDPSKPQLAGVDHDGNYIYEYSNGKVQTVPKNQVNEFNKQFENKVKKPKKE